MDITSWGGLGVPLLESGPEILTGQSILYIHVISLMCVYYICTCTPFLVMGWWQALCHDCQWGHMLSQPKLSSTQLGKRVPPVEQGRRCTAQLLSQQGASPA